MPTDPLAHALTSLADQPDAHRDVPGLEELVVAVREAGGVAL